MSLATGRGRGARGRKASDRRPRPDSLATLGSAPAEGRGPGAPLLLGTRGRAGVPRPGCTLTSPRSFRQGRAGPPRDAVAVTPGGSWHGDVSGQGGWFRNAAEPEAAGPASLARAPDTRTCSPCPDRALLTRRVFLQPAVPSHCPRAACPHPGSPCRPAPRRPWH